MYRLTGKSAGRAPVFTGYTLTFALQLRKKHRKTSVRVTEECQLARWKHNTQNRTYIKIRIHKHNNKNTYFLKLSVFIFVFAPLQHHGETYYVYWTVHHCDSWRIRDQPMSLVIMFLFHFLYVQHVSDINSSIIRSLWLFYCITTLVVCV